MTNSLCRSALTLVAATALHTAAAAQDFAGYDGRMGYQELTLSAHTHYLAFHGNRSTSGPWVDAAWAARAAQLCKAQGSESFVSLRYVEEPVLTDDPQVAWEDADAPRVIRVAAPVYIPMFISSGPRNASIDGPGKSGPVRCMPAGATLREPGRAVQVSAALEAARRAGVPVR